MKTKLNFRIKFGTEDLTITSLDGKVTHTTWHHDKWIIGHDLGNILNHYRNIPGVYIERTEAVIE